MNNQILQFYLTDHFMKRGWERTIDKPLLYKMLPHVECTNCDTDIVLVFPSFLQKKGLGLDCKKCLLLVIRSKVIITAYWVTNPNYTFNKKENPHYQILY